MILLTPEVEWTLKLIPQYKTALKDKRRLMQLFTENIFLKKY